jgi:hypothetical protein
MTIQAFTQDQVRALRTARFSERAHAMQSGLPTATVRIAFAYGAFNAFFRRNECVFACYAGDEDTTLLGHYYQNALIDFRE